MSGLASAQNIVLLNLELLVSRTSSCSIFSKVFCFTLFELELRNALDSKIHCKTEIQLKMTHSIHESFAQRMSKFTHKNPAHNGLIHKQTNKRETEKLRTIQFRRNVTAATRNPIHSGIVAKRHFDSSALSIELHLNFEDEKMCLWQAHIRNV